MGRPKVKTAIPKRCQKCKKILATWNKSGLCSNDSQRLKEKLNKIKLISTLFK